MAMKGLLGLAAVLEAATGLVLLVYPAIVVRLLFGAEIAGAGMVMSRIAGIGLVGLGIACWPSRDTRGRAGWPLCGLRTYSSLVTLYLACLGIRGEWVGMLLWPAVAAHAVLTCLLARAWFKG